MPATQNAPAASRRLALHRRSDLAARPVLFRGQSFWAVKDPLALRYFHLREEEYFLLQSLDGQVSLEKLRDVFEARFAPRRITLQQIQSFLGMLHREGLIVADAPGQGEELLTRANTLRRQRWVQTAGNLLAMRFRGIDPDRFLNWLAPRTDWLFSGWFLAVCVSLILSALALVAVQFNVVRERLPDFDAFFTVSNFFWLSITLACIKILHELGHALACKRFGSECHEIGLMLLVFTPCLYCNVTDAWMIPEKRRRAAVGFAGIAVELVLASLGTFLWWFSHPGLFNSLCLNVMFVCSVSTLLFNGNPLLRYDGYYILSDLLEVPNLSQQSATIVRRALGEWFLGIESDPDESFSRRGRIGLAFFAMASFAYRLFITGAILWFFYRVLKPYRLESLAQMLAIAVVSGMIAAPLWRAIQFFRNPYWSAQMNYRRLAVRGTLAVVLLGAGLFIPLPHRIHVPAVIEPQDAKWIYAAVPGTLVKSVSAGKKISRGDTLARLVNTDLAYEIEQLRGRRDQQKMHLETLKRRQVKDNTAAAQVPTAEEALADLEDRLSKRLVDQERLTLVAPVDGTVLPPRPKAAPQTTEELPTWTGTPLDTENRNCHLETGTLVCLVGDPDRMEAILIIDQSDVEFVREGQTVRVLFEQLPEAILTGKITEIAELDLRIIPPELVRERELPVQRDDSGAVRPLSAAYQARVALDQHGHRLLLGETGRAKILADPRTLAARLARTMSRTFRFEL